MNCNLGVTYKKLPISVPLCVIRLVFGRDPGLPHLLDVTQVHSYLLMKAKQASVPGKVLWLNGSCGLFHTHGVGRRHVLHTLWCW